MILKKMNLYLQKTPSVFCMTKLFTCLILLLPSLFAIGQIRFEIKGHIDNAPAGAKMFFLKETGEIDSVTINNGWFYFEGQRDNNNPAFSLLLPDSLTNLENRLKQKTFWIDSPIIDIRADYKQFSRAIIKGSFINTDNQAFEDYLRKLDPARLEKDQANRLYRMAAKRFYSLPIEKRNQAIADSVSNLALFGIRQGIAFDSLETAHIVAYVQHHPSSYRGLLEVYNRRARIRFITLKNIFQHTDAKLLNFPYGKLVAAYIANHRDLVIGDTAPDFNLTGINGEQVSLRSFRGKYILLEFWGSWCAPCRWENIAINKLYTRYRHLAFDIIGIGLDTKDGLLRAIDADKIEWRNVAVPEMFNARIALQYGVWTAPSNFLIDPNGKIIGIDLKEAAVKTGQKKLSEVLKELF